jgi:hypothetical protein
MNRYKASPRNQPHPLECQVLGAIPSRIIDFGDGPIVPKTVPKTSPKRGMVLPNRVESGQHLLDSPGGGFLFFSERLDARAESVLHAFRCLS